MNMEEFDQRNGKINFQNRHPYIYGNVENLNLSINQFTFGALIWMDFKSLIKKIWKLLRINSRG